MKVITLVTLFLASPNLLATTTYACKFNSFSDEKGKHSGELLLTYLLDKEAGNSFLVGNNGSSEVAHIFRGDGRSFVEITEAGNVMTTTITGEGKAVHSRNSVMLGQLIPSQYYGECVVQ
jgi:hypothetical protein